ncbi:hypothetical protein ACH5RR_038570 [Cinchona calisaya]|uniref:DUF7054 domain-containing protein n=1 Tax=Cinchona calisaya TaxID=153742 RepID=A0ABD2XYZ5_9GENT
MFYFIVFFFTSKMAFLQSPLKHRNEGGTGTGNSNSQSRLVGSFASASATVWGNNNERKQMSKLLMNVTLQNSLGPVQVVMSPENTVEELVKAVVEIYVRDKRRPLLASGDPRSFELHYSQFCLEGLKPEEKLKTLGSRNFFLLQKPRNAVNSSCSEQAKADSSFPLIKLMDILL